jgi:hypothetical protein
MVNSADKEFALAWQFRAKELMIHTVKSFQEVQQ